MRKVAEWLDEKFHQEQKTELISIKGVHGSWSYPYPEDIIMVDSETSWSDQQVIPLHQIICTCNNQTMQFRMRVNGEYCDIYGYLQTYEHISRGEARYKWLLCKKY